MKPSDFGIFWGKTSKALPSRKHVMKHWSSVLVLPFSQKSNVGSFFCVFVERNTQLFGALPWSQLQNVGFHDQCDPENWSPLPLHRIMGWHPPKDDLPARETFPRVVFQDLPQCFLTKFPQFPAGEPSFTAFSKKFLPRWVTWSPHSVNSAGGGTPGGEDEKSLRFSTRSLGGCEIRRLSGWLINEIQLSNGFKWAL